METDKQRSTVTNIEKKDLAGLKYERDDVMNYERDKNKRQDELKRAAVLGAVQQQPAKIIFKTKEGIMKLEAVILSVTTKYVSLRGVDNIPIRAIIGVKMVEN